MSELIKIENDSELRWKLLAGVSVFALVTSSIGFSYARDADRPAVWIELGGQLTTLEDEQETFSPPLMDGRPAIFEPSQKFEKPPGHSFDEVGSISVEPGESNWVISASVQYGRSKSSKHNLQQTNPKPTSVIRYTGYPAQLVYPTAQQFAETKASTTEQHVVVDFQVGKDVGLGLFNGQDDSSFISLGVRIAQFRSASNVTLKSDPDWHFFPKYFNSSYYGHHFKFMNQAFHSNLASMTAKRSFQGIGPSFSWKASVPVAGNMQDGEIAADWGINAAVLFGRQKAQTHHQSTARYRNTSFKYNNGPIPQTISRFPATPDHTRSRSVVVPNIGGFAGFSFKYPDAKVSFGYKADFFFGAMDGGIDSRKTYDRDFYGPYASITIGLGG